MKNAKELNILFNFIIFFTGFSGFCVQMLLLRELLIIFSGNELSIGIILTNWLIFEALGSYLAGCKHIFSKKNFSFLTLIFGIYIPFGVYFIRILKNFIKIPFGQPTGITHILFFPFLILFIPAFIHGALFTFCCKIYSELTDRKNTSAGYTYIYETLGTTLGGLIWTYLLIPYFHSFYISLFISSLNFLISFIMLSFFSQKNKTKTLLTISFLFFLSSLFLISTKTVNKLHRISILKQWKGLNIITYQNSIYGNISVSENDGQYTFFLNGIPHFVIPVPDISYVEQFAHLPLLLHPFPEKILIISGSIELINEILKYKTIKSIDYIEIDPVIIEIIKNLPSSLIKILNSEKVKIVNEDGRFYLNRTKEKYDVIFIGISDLTNLQSNRFFTKEFFTTVKKKLNKNGILIFGIQGNLTFINEELNKLHKCIFETLHSVFYSPHPLTTNVRVIPGTGSFLYLASENEKILWIDKIEKEKYKSSLFYLDYKLHPGWFNLYNNVILKEKVIDINYDFKPIGLFYSISYWNTIFASYLRPFFKIMEKMDIKKFLFFLFSIFSISILLRIKTKEKFYKFIPFSIFTTGFVGMIYNLIIIFSFQIIYGFVFYLIGILTTFFMTGSIIGALIGNSISKRYKNLKKFFLITEIIIIFHSICIPFFITLFSKFILNLANFHLSIYIFLLISLISGFLIGIQFPLANTLYLNYEDKIEKTAGVLYSNDLIGGCIGGLLGSLFLFPILGIFNTCIILSFIKMFSLFNLIIKV